MEEYKPNSHKSKEERKESIPEKHVEKVISGTVKPKKKSEMQKFADVFISEDVNNVKSYIVMDVLVPAIKKAICAAYDCEHAYDHSWQLGKADHELMMRLAAGGPTHAKYRRMITVYMDITAPLYWWKEFDTYKVGTVANSCSTMHKIAEKEFDLGDFSYEHLFGIYDRNGVKNGLALDVSPLHDRSVLFSPCGMLRLTIQMLNMCREKYLETKEKKYWWQMIQLLPSSYNQKRTIMLNYEVLAGVYPMRKNHKLDEWVEFCKWIEQLPYSEIITGKKSDKEKQDD